MPSFLERIKARKFASAASTAVDVGVDGDTQARLTIDAGGKVTWGDGGTVGDTNLYRDAANVLKTDDTLKVPTLFVDGIEIDTTGAVSQDVLLFNGTKFTAASATFGGGANALNDLTDVTVSAPEKYQTLVYDGTSWINEFPTTVSLVNNAEATTLQIGEVVYLFGNVGNHASVKRADNDSDVTSSKTVGMVSTAIPSGGNGPVVTRGYVTGMDLSSGYTAGDILWLGESGGFTKTKPTAPEHLVFVGIVVRATNNGIIYVACQNGYELDELHDVSISAPLSNGQFLKFNGSLWVNDEINLATDTVGNYLSSITAGTGISVNFTPGEDVGASVSLSATLDQLSDVTVPSPSSGDFLKWNGTAWVNDAIDLGTDTTGNYVQSLVAGTGITLTNGTASEGGTPTISVTSNTYQPLDADLTAIAGLAGTSGVLKKTAADTWALDTSTFVTTSDTGTVTSAMIANNTIVDADISTSAAIALSKLSTVGAALDNVIKFNGSAWTAASAGGANVTTAATAPTGAVSGDLWLDSVNLDLYIRYDNNWVQLTGTDPLIEDLNDLADVVVPSPSVGQFLRFDGTNWTAASIPTINALDDIGDVNVTGATNGQFLRWNGSNWTAASIPTINALDDIGDVNVTGATSGQFLKWNGSAWVPDTVVGGATASSGAPSSPTTGQMWFDTDDARTYIYYDSYWVEVGASGMAATVSDSAPSNPIAGQVWYKSDTGGTYIYYNSNWVEVGPAPAITSTQVTTALGFTPANAATAATTGKAIAMSIVFGG